MRNKFKVGTLVLSAILGASLGGCALYTEPGKRYDKAEAQLDEAQSIRSVKPKYRNGGVSQAIYVDQIKPGDVEKPNWYFKDKKVNLSKVPFDTALQNTFFDESVQFKYTDNLDLGKLVTVRSNSTLGEALESLANASGYSYSIDNNVVTWSRLQFKTIDISMFSGTESFGIGKSGSSGSSSEQSFSTIETVASNVISSSDEYIHLSGEMDVVSDIVNSLNSVKSKDGEVIVNKGTMTVMIHDLPENIKKMEKIMNDMNENLTRLVAIDMTIINVELNDQYNLGIQWNAIAKELAGNGIDLSTSGGNFMADMASANSPIYTLTRTTGKWTGTELLMKALQGQGSVSNKTLPRATTLNNRAVKLRDIQRTNFILERSITTTANVGSEGSIKQGTVETGFSLYAIPKITRGDVILRLTTNLSTLIKLDKKDSSVGNSSGSSSNQEVYVEAPIVNDKDFDNTVVIGTGDTLILAGLSTDTSTTQENNNGADILGMSKSAQGKRVETLILITPNVLRGVHM
ncbi:type II secretion system protein GspD [Aeromonas dhakensis]|uniref:type II secretion system protein GspD n=1 Tax=Aeromonas dhakensis TaxID=196024 RepID=UPI00398793F1